MDDLISRQAVIEAVLELDAKHRVSWKDAVIDMLDALPSAQPERKKAEWNYYYRKTTKDTFVCNGCGACFVVIQGADKMNYCPNCGAEMEE